ncbi:MAG: DUF3459 domain-containing protein, partial [Xanthomonadaceae bacterium]|nr:DUF3459 domain-containing protein [Xanthomonadaceae bacterium]
AGDGSAVSVQAEQADPHSLLNWYRMLIGWRRAIPALRDGTLRNWRDANLHVAAWELDDAHGDVLVLHNLFDQPQTVSLPTQRFNHLLKHSLPGTRIVDNRLSLPAYGSAILGSD